MYLGYMFDELGRKMTKEGTRCLHKSLNRHHTALEAPLHRNSCLRCMLQHPPEGSQVRKLQSREGNAVLPL